jgi:hypothetical protein
MAQISGEAEALGKLTFGSKETAGLRGGLEWSQIMLLLLPIYGKNIDSNRNDSMHTMHGYSLIGIIWRPVARWTPRPIAVQSLPPSLVLLMAICTRKAIELFKRGQILAWQVSVLDKWTPEFKRAPMPKGLKIQRPMASAKPWTFSVQMVSVILPNANS